MRTFMGSLSFVKKEDLLKKFVLLAAMLAMMLTAFAPLVLAQQEVAPSEASEEPAGFFVGCQILFGDPAATCLVDENGFILLPDGSTLAPVVVEPDGTAFIVNEDGTLSTIGQGTSLLPGEEPTTPTEEPTVPAIQYDNAEG